MTNMSMDMDDTTDLPRVVKMANQIVEALASSPDVEGAVAEHIEQFWEPRMRAQLQEALAEGGEGLHPAARAAALRLPPVT